MLKTRRRFLDLLQHCPFNRSSTDACVVVPRFLSSQRCSSQLVVSRVVEKWFVVHHQRLNVNKNIKKRVTRTPMLFVIPIGV